MVIGIALFSWDQKIGSVIDVKYPKNLDLTEDLINKIYMTFAYSEDFEKEELIETSYKEQTILSYCDKTRVAKVGYEIITLILEEKENVNIFKIKKQLLEFGKNTFIKEKSERNQFFLDNTGIFFETSSAKKILLLGRAGTGKTSIKKIIFEGVDPKDLLYNPLEPTRGITPSVWLDLKLGLFDSSGQELSFLLENEEDREHILAFDNTDYIVYLFDYPGWISQSQELVTEIQKIQKILKRNSYSTKLLLFFHKIDLIGKDIDNKIIDEISANIKKNFDLPLYFTSIHPDLIYSLYNAFYEILSISSDENIKLKEILESEIKYFQKTMFFITNTHNSIVVQSMSKDFNTTIINHTHKLVAQLNQTFEDMTKSGNIDHLILSSYDNLNIIMNNTNLLKFSLKYLICISETATANKLIWLVGQIRSKLKDLYYFNKSNK
jgi:Ras-related GTP-binding protein A/B